MLPRLIAFIRGDRVTATFLVTAPAHTGVRAGLYCAGAEFNDARVAFFDWSFTVRARRQSWERFVATCQVPLQQLTVAPA